MEANKTNYGLSNTMLTKIECHYCSPKSTNAQSSNAGEFHPYVLTEPYVNLSIHTALQDASINRQTSRLPVVWINSSIIPCGCLVFTNFYILCIPLLLLTFISYLRYYGYIRPCSWFVKAYCLLRVLRLKVLPLCRLYVIATLQKGLPSLAYSTSTGSPVPPMRLSVSPGGFIPDAANTSGN